LIDLFLHFYKIIYILIYLNKDKYNRFDNNNNKAQNSYYKLILYISINMLYKVIMIMKIYKQINYLRKDKDKIFAFRMWCYRVIKKIKKFFLYIKYMY